MKKILFGLTAVFFLSSSILALDFQPTVMKITSEKVINYSFDGTPLTFEFDLTGKASGMYLIINTKGQSEKIKNVRNGYLGWHYVNKIDTTVFISEKYSRSTGKGQIIWNGKDESGNLVVPGDYTYYLWGYDDKSPRELVSAYIQVGFDWEAQYTHVIEKGEDGLPLAKPLLFMSNPWWRHNEVTAPPQNICAHGTMVKWSVGGDPQDITLCQTTYCDIYTPDAAAYSYGGAVLDPTDFDTFYHCSVNITASTSTMLKWQFVAGGLAVRDQTWMGWDKLTWDQTGDAIAVWSQKPSCYTDGNYIYVQSPGLHQKTYEWNKLRCVSFDGEVVFDKMMHDWYMPDDPNPHGTINGAFHHLYSRTPNEWYLQSHTCCMMQMINTTRLISDADDEVNMVMWYNSNGDYFLDNAYQADASPTWFCNSQRKGVDLRRESISIDANGFSITGLCYVGLVSFAVQTQDGTGIGYMQFIDEGTYTNPNLIKGGGLLCDNGSAYDGFYWMGPVQAGYGGNDWMLTATTNYSAFDSFQGVLTNQSPVAADENKTFEFRVDQNAPNPFNPSTNISFTVPKSDRVTVEVFNIAGQKIAVLADGVLSPGRHTLKWDASGKSAGVYFYTVKAGNFSKTMKMTLLK